MVSIHKNFFSDDIINYICNLTDVIKAKEQLESSNLHSKYFSINVTPEIQQILFDKLGLNLTNITMRWIKGDTKPHIDHGKSKFDNTHLVYLTESEGDLLIEDESYPIEQNTAYVFSEGLRHETLNTGYNPRLLLGPMSETGFEVGASTTIIADGATDTIYFKYDSGTGVEYKINDGSYNGVSLPITIINSNTSSTLKTLFETDMILTTSIFYFICGSDNIQFGSTSLNNDGTRPVITIDNVLNYPGLIQNGYAGANGFNKIYVYNLEITTENGSTLAPNAGWFGQEYFAKGVGTCYIVNCHSDGPIIDAGGGIVGGYAASNEGNLKIIGCSSSGDSGDYSGGIVGYYAGRDGGIINCTGCWSTGIIGNRGGGIYGYSAGDTTGEVIATNCYSTGNIGITGGGIFGQVPGANLGGAGAVNCYSSGNIGTDAGGIFGSGAASDDGSTSATNSYSTGTITTPGNGIYGSNIQSGATTTNCYAANGAWNTTTANTNLTGEPVSPSVVGTTWVATVINQPYELLNMGYTPYNINNISVSGSGVPSLVRTSNETIVAGTSTESAIVSEKSYTIIEKSGGDSGSYSTITIDSTTGVISTTSSTSTGTYTLILRNDGSYNITSFSLTVTESPPSNTQRINSFRVSNLLSDNLANSIALAQSGSAGFGIHNSFTVYDTLLLQLVNDALIDN